MDPKRYAELLPDDTLSRMCIFEHDTYKLTSPTGNLFWQEFRGAEEHIQRVFRLTRSEAWRR